MEQIVLYGSKSRLEKVLTYLKKKFVVGSVHQYIVCNATIGMSKDLKRQGLTK